MGVAVGLLFIAIVLRVVRRIRGNGPADGDDADPPPDGEPGGEPADEPHPEHEPAAPAR